MKEKQMIPDHVRKQFLKQHYALVGKHSAVQICEWNKKSLRNEGYCYKQKFYGINSHRCCQMSPAISWCPHKCLFCWRSIENTIGSKMPKKGIDDPRDIIEECIKAQRKLIAGFGGNKKADKNKFKEAQQPMHFAISLTGEPTAYPRISELIKEIKKRNYTSFLVTNGEFPNVLAKMEMPTQLYVSLIAPNEEIFNTIARPQIKNGWKNLMKTLGLLKKFKKKTRTVLRLTLVRELNMKNPEQYAKLIKKAQPMFVECKAYMAIGFSRERLGLKFMPLHEEIKEFAQQIAKSSGYKIVDEKKDSRVVLLMNKSKKDIKSRFIKF